MRQRIQVLYDGDCGLCQRSARLLQRLDLFARLEWIDFRTSHVSVDPARLEHEMAAMTRGFVHFGFYAWRQIAWVIPAFWPIAPVLYLPGVPTLGEAIYRHIAERRHGVCGTSRLPKRE